MRKLTSLLAAGLLAFSVFGQNQQIDALRKGLEKAATPAEKSAVAAQLSGQFLALGKVADAAVMADLAFSESQKTTENPLKAAAFEQKGQVLLARFDPAGAMREFVDALKMRQESSDPKGWAQTKNWIGRAFFLQGDAASAIENHQRALEVFDAKHDLGAMAETNRMLGNAFLSQKLMGKALEHFRSALDQKIEAEDIAGAAEIASFLGKQSNEMGDGDAALVYFRQSLDLNQSTENLPRMAEDFSNIARALIHQGNFLEASAAVETAKKIALETRDSLRMAENLQNQAVIFAKTGLAARAVSSLDSTAGLLGLLMGRPGTPEIWQSMAATWRDLGNAEKSFSSMQNWAKARDAVFSSEKNKALLELTTRFESEFAAEKQKAQIQNLELEKSNSARVRWFLIGLLALGALAVWSLFRANAIKKRDNLILKTKNDEIDSKNRELADKNSSLDILNSKLVNEIAERENIERTTLQREKFLARMSHEMRSPMNNILALTRELLDNKPRSEQVDSLREMQFSAGNMVVFINDMLDFSKIETGKLALDQVEFDPSKVLEEVRRRFMPLLHSKKAKFRLEYDANIPTNLVGDPARLNQILTNIVSASAAETDMGEVLVQVGLQENSEKEALLRVAVIDNGGSRGGRDLGKLIEAGHNLDELFEENDSTTLGLAIAKRLVDLQNGKLEARSQAEGGNSFLLWLPFQKPSSTAKKGPLDPEKAARALNGKRVLVVEDNKINQLVVQKMLSKAGMIVTTADDGEVAVERFFEGDFDLVLMDIQMPVMDGYRATAEMRKTAEPRKKSVPIIALTASAYLTDRDKAALFQMNDHIGKPFAPEELMEKVAAFFVF